MSSTPLHRSLLAARWAAAWVACCPFALAHAFQAPQTMAEDAVLTELKPAAEVAAVPDDYLLAGSLPAHVDGEGIVTFLGRRPLGSRAHAAADDAEQVGAVAAYFAQAADQEAIELQHIATHDDVGQVRHVFVQVHAGLPVLGTYAIAKVEGGDLTYARHYLVDPAALAAHGEGRNAAEEIGPARAGEAAIAYFASLARPAEVTAPPTLSWLYQRRRFALVWETAVHTASPLAEWSVFVGARSGEVVGRRKMSLDGVHGIIRAHVEPACQGDATAAVPLPHVRWHAEVPGPDALADADGLFAHPGEAGAARVLLDGAFVRVENAEASPWSLERPLLPDPAFNDLLAEDAPSSEVSAYIHVHRARSWLRGHLEASGHGSASGSPSRIWQWTERPLTVRVDLPSRVAGEGCNAFYDGEALNFYGDDKFLGCNNTARVAKIVYHEYGHGIHDHLTASRSTYNEQVSEGIADYVSASITGDPRLTGLLGCEETVRARENLRSCDNSYNYCRSRRCSSRPGDEQHNAGPVLCGALWDLRQALTRRYGAAEGHRVADRFFLRFLTLVTDMGSAYTAAIAADDDDDDNPANGTRHSCEINEAFLGEGVAKRAHFPEARAQRVPCRPEAEAAAAP